MLDDEGKQVLVRLLEARPQSSVEDVLPELERQTGKAPSIFTLRRYLRQLGYRRRRPVVVPTERPTPDPTTRYRDIHRRDPKDGYPSDLTDQEWEMLAPLFDNAGKRGRPPKYERRQMLDGVFYVVRSGCAWRMLPTSFPPWQSVYSHFRRWAAAGLFEDMHDLLRSRWREREGRNADPSAGIVDSQSVKTTEKGGLGATTAARRSMGASATSS
jgi:transposase